MTEKNTLGPGPADAGADVTPAPVYLAYGLQIRSSVPLPELPATAIRPGAEVTVRTGALEAPAERPAPYYRESATTTYLRWDDVGTFRVRNGREIVVQPAGAADEERVAYYLLGPVFAVLLHQRGDLVLHASAVATPGGAVLFLADSGGGKSSVAAAFGMAGFDLIADDVVPVTRIEARAVTHAGSPRVHVWPETVHGLDLSPSALAPVCPDHEKQFMVGRRGSGTGPIAIRHLFVLEEGSAVATHASSRAEACLELVRHCYLAERLHPAERGRQLAQCAGLARTVGLSRVAVPGRLPALPGLVRYLMAELTEL